MDSGHPQAGTVIDITVAKGFIRWFSSFFIEGVSLPVNTGGTLKEVICDQLGVAEGYFEERIQTIFLNFKAVDKPEKALVKDGAIIALSAAMPGLVGATMRKGGTYAVLRSSISFSETDGMVEQHRGWITLKLLNMVARELGPLFLAKGVYVADEKVVSFLKARGDEFENQRCEVSINGSVSSLEQVIKMKLSGGKVCLIVSERS